jgi:hypothetical protein
MVIDEDGQRIGRFESGDPNWRAGDTFTLGEQLLRILEILPEVSTMVAYKRGLGSDSSHRQRTGDLSRRARGRGTRANSLLDAALGGSARDFERNGERAARL